MCYANEAHQQGYIRKLCAPQNLRLNHWACMSVLNLNIGRSDRGRGRLTEQYKEKNVQGGNGRCGTQTKLLN